MSKSTMGNRISAGLVLSGVGDILLAYHSHYPSDMWFISGLVAFLIGHIIYVSAFDSKNLSEILMRGSIAEKSKTVAVLIVIGSLMFWLTSHIRVKHMKIAVAVYCIVIGS